jgi:hypothetical protein
VQQRGRFRLAAIALGASANLWLGCAGNDDIAVPAPGAVQALGNQIVFAQYPSAWVNGGD